jgi:hypothetical protein
MEPTEHTLPTTTEKISEPAAPERVDRSRAEIFTHDLDRINAAIIDMLQDETTNPAELREAWNVRADLAEDFINSLEPTPDNPNPKPRVWFDILVDKALIFEAVGNTVRYLEELDDAEAFARTYHLDDMAVSVDQELEEKVAELGDTPEELLLKLRGQLSFPMRYKLREMLQDGIEHDDFTRALNKMLVGYANGLNETLVQLDIE